MVRLNRIEKARRLGFGLDKNHTVDSDGSLRSKCINGVKHINIYREREKRKRTMGIRKSMKRIARARQIEGFD